MNKKRFNFLLLFTILGAVILTYSNHFHNPFQFDDHIHITSNVFIKDLKNIPLFFTDITTSSTDPTQQLYRPMVLVTAAMDYYLGGELNPFYFHLSMFFWFLVQLLLMFFLFRKILNMISNHKWVDYMALFAVAWYGLHTANAETINYIISRSDSLSTLCVVASLYLYIAFPNKRKWYFYLLPFIVGMLFKEHTAMFVPILFFYILLFETPMSLSDIFKKGGFKHMKETFLKSFPTIIVCVVLIYLVIKTPMIIRTSEIATPKVGEAFNYLITQPWVLLRYFIAFFLPVNLSADSDWSVFNNVLDERAIVGYVFVIIMIVVAFRTSKKEKTKPIAFGIIWFFFSLLPTSSIFPFGQVTNDHRMFFPFVGLTLSIVWAIGLYIIKIEKNLYKSGVLLLGFAVLAANAYGVRERNKVWSSGENLWYDVTIKSPKNARGLMNYALSQMEKGNFDVALDYYNRALVYSPYYAYLHTNLGVLKNAMNNPAEAEEHFLKAILYQPTIQASYYYYARFLRSQNRISEAIRYAEYALSLSPACLQTRHLLLDLYYHQKQKEKLNKLNKETLNIYPNDTYTMQFLNMDTTEASPLKIAEQIAKNNPTPENYLNLSLQYYNNQLYNECIEACYEALKLKPDYSDAYNNICTAYNQLKMYDKAIEACDKALSISPNYELARNNRKLAIERQKKQCQAGVKKWK